MQGKEKSFRVVPALDEASRREAYRLRYQVFVEELGQTVTDATRDRGLIERYDTNSRVLVAYDGATAVGTTAVDCWNEVSIDAARRRALDLDRFAQRYSRDGIFIIRKAAVLPSHRMSSVFRDLITGIYEYVFSTREPRFLFLYSAPQRVRLYERFGFRCYAPHFDMLGKTSVPMCLVINDHDYLSLVPPRVLETVKSFGHPHLPDVAGFFAEQWYKGARAPSLQDNLPKVIDPNSEIRYSLTQSPLLEGVEHQDAEQFLLAGEKIFFQRGQPIIEAADAGTDLFLITRGHVEVTLRRDGRGIVVATFGPGDVFGEMNMLLHSGRTSDVVAQTEVEALRVSEDTFRNYFAAAPGALAKINFNLACILARRLQITNRLLS